MAKILKKALAVTASAAIAASVITVPVIANAADATISYSDGYATASANGKLIAASYGENGVLEGVHIYNASANNPVKVDVAEGDKLMLWNGLDGEETMKPLADVYEVTAAVEPTEAATEAPAETQAPATEAPADPTQAPATEAPATEAPDDVKVIKSWKFDFGSTEDVADGFTAVTADVNYTLNNAGEDQYGFIGTNENDYKLGNRLDGFSTQKGQKIELTAGGGTGLYDGIGSTGADSYGNAGDKYYPVRFALKVPEETYYRVRATVTTLDPTKDATASLYTERKHPIFTETTIPAGKTITKEFTIRVTPIYYEKSDPKGTAADGMVNVCVLGTNSAFASLEVDQIETAPVLWVLGDSTVTDGNCNLPFSPLQNYTGVGTGLTKYLPKNIAMVNEGEGGLAANDNNHFNMVKNRIKSGDYMYVEYGHNHKNDGPAGYLGNLDKYYQACKNAGATLIIVGPIDRHNTYNAETNVWSTSLAQFSRAGKGYVDSMMYGGEAAANQFVSTYKADGETAALAYRDSVVDSANGQKAVEAIAFVDLNQPSLDWFATVTAKGSIGGVELTNSTKLIDYYFQTSRGGSTDGTHPNDTGAQNLAYFFFTTADTEAYPALLPLMKNFMPGQTHETPTPVEQAAMDAGNKAGQGNVGWPQYVVPTDNEYPVAIKNITFNDDGTVASAKVVVQDAKFAMTAYGIIVITINDEDGNEIGKLYAVDQVDNSTGTGEQIIVNFKGDAVLPAEGSYSAQVWQALDTESGLQLDPQNIAYSAIYTPTEIVEYILPGDTSDVETFEYYGTEVLTGDATKYVFGGSAGHDLTLGSEDETTYVRIMSDGAKNGSANQGSFYIMRPLENLANGTGATGKYMISVDLRYVSGGGVKFGFAKSTKNSSPFVTEGGFTAFSVDSDGFVHVPGASDSIGAVGGIGWTNVKYILDMSAGVATVSVGSGSPVTVPVVGYQTFGEPTPDTLKHFIIEGQKVAFDILASNLTVAQLRSGEKTTLTVASEDANKGSAYIDEPGTSSKKIPIATEITATATANDGYRFIGWYNGDELFSDSETIAIARLYKNLDLTAKFVEQTTPASVTVKFVDTEGTPLKDEVVVSEADGKQIYTQTAFTLTGDEYTSVIKNADGELYDVYVYDKEKSDSFTIDSLAENNTINVVFNKLDGKYFEYEDFSDSAVGKWGFTEGKSGNVTTADGILYLFKNVGTSAQNSDVKTLSDSIAAAQKVTVSFDWRNGVENGKGRNSLFDLYDNDGRYVFSLNASGKDGLSYGVGEVANNNNKVSGGVNDWYRVVLNIDFTAGKLSGTITDLANGAVTTVTETTIEATNLARMQADYGYSAAPQYLDNVSFKEGK